jgi:hypothetical protein
VVPRRTDPSRENQRGCTGAPLTHVFGASQRRTVTPEWTNQRQRRRSSAAPASPVSIASAA